MGRRVRRTGEAKDGDGPCERTPDSAVASELLWAAPHTAGAASSRRPLIGRPLSSGRNGRRRGKARQQRVSATAMDAILWTVHRGRSSRAFTTAVLLAADDRTNSARIPESETARRPITARCLRFRVAPSSVDRQGSALAACMLTHAQVPDLIHAALASRLCALLALNVRRRAQATASAPRDLQTLAT
jgi:hypothetical protein